MICLEVNGRACGVESRVFSGGEVNIVITGLEDAMVIKNAAEITAFIKSSNDLMELMFVTDALRQYDQMIQIDLIIPYFPYARQDRVCHAGEAFSLKFFCRMINAQNYKSVTVADAHSLVALALVDRVININQSIFALHIPHNYEVDYIVAPDAGAAKKAEQFADRMNEAFSDGVSTLDVQVIQALKVRDKTGAISKTTVLCEDLNGYSCLIVDDICDGGATFVALAKALKDKGAARVDLYVTHGIFRNGTKELVESGIDRIFTTDSFYTETPASMYGDQFPNIEIIFSF